MGVFAVKRQPRRVSRLSFVVLRIPGTRLTAAGKQQTRDARGVGVFIETTRGWF